MSVNFCHPKHLILYTCGWLRLAQRANFHLSALCLLSVSTGSVSPAGRRCPMMQDVSSKHKCSSSLSPLCTSQTACTQVPCTGRGPGPDPVEAHLASLLACG